MHRGFPEVALEVLPQERWVLRESLAAIRDELACAGGGEEAANTVLGGGGGSRFVEDTRASPIYLLYIYYI